MYWLLVVRSSLIHFACTGVALPRLVTLLAKWIKLEKVRLVQLTANLKTITRSQKRQRCSLQSLQHLSESQMHCIHYLRQSA